MSTPSKSPPDDPVLEITQSILTEAAQRPWLAALLMRRRPDWLTRLAQLAQRVRDLPRHTRRALRRKLASGLAAAALLLALAGPPPTVYAASITVDGDGTVGTCSLADAITSANTDTATGYCPAGSDADTITLTVDVTLAAALPPIDSEIIIEGGMHTIQGDNTFTILTVQSGGNLTLNAATISGGTAVFGGGIYNSGMLTVSNSTISGNAANLSGGGIFNMGTVTVINSTLSANTAMSGGGVANAYGGSLTVQNTTLSGNTAYAGGGIDNAGNGSNTTVSNSTLSGNTANNLGGGIFNSNNSTLAVQSSTLSGNTADSVGGGIGNASGTLTVQKSTLSNNTASSGGGIVNLDNGDTTVTDSTLSGNQADNNIEGTANGAGIANYGGTLLVQNSTISGNTGHASAGAARGGGIYNYDVLTVSNSTISGNLADEGGGLYNNYGTATIEQSTITGNTGVYGAGIANYGSLTIQNSIVALQAYGSDCGVYSSPPLSLGYNIETAEDCGLTNGVNGDNQLSVSGESLTLLPLANNGSQPHPFTHALDDPSVSAIDRIPIGTNGCGDIFATDERGAVRADGAGRGGPACDIGAYEVSTETPTAITLRDLTATTNASPGIIGAIGTALAALGALVIGRKATNKHRING